MKQYSNALIDGGDAFNFDANKPPNFLARSAATSRSQVPNASNVQYTINLRYSEHKRRCLYIGGKVFEGLLNSFYNCEPRAANKNSSSALKRRLAPSTLSSTRSGRQFCSRLRSEGCVSAEWTSLMSNDCSLNVRRHSPQPVSDSRLRLLLSFDSSLSLYGGGGELSLRIDIMDGRRESGQILSQTIELQCLHGCQSLA